MKSLLVALAFLALCAGVSSAQKGKADPDYYPLGYTGDTWTGEVTAFDNQQRTLTLTSGGGKKAATFVASIPDAPYEWVRDIRNDRVLDFPYDPKSEYQLFKYEGQGFAASALPDTGGAENPSGMKRRPNPPASNQITDLSDFMGRRVTVYYTVREREAGGKKEKYNDVWRVKVLSGKKK
jgi:hypothetical protein